MMRITNSMMMNTTKTNINNNKVAVDKLNTQMSTQKKIVKPSDNPLIAIKSLRLSTTLSKINQYYGTNIKDAESWLDVTETALTNMKDIMKDAYTLCVQGANDTLTDDDRSAILTQLKGLSSQVYNEANSDYANRTIFTGYKTNSTVAFTDSLEASQAKYEITEQLKATDIETYSYYANQLDTPISTEIANQTAVGVPQEEDLKRLRLSYSDQTKLDSFAYTYAVDTTSGAASGSTNGNVTITDTIDEQTFQWRSSRKDSSFTYEADSNGKMTGASLQDLNGYTLSIATDGTLSVSDKEIQNNSSVRRTSYTDATTGDLMTVETTTFSDVNGNAVFTSQVTTNGDGKITESYVVDSQGNKVELEYKFNATTKTNKLRTVTDPQGNSITTNLVGTGKTITVKKADGTTAMTAESKTDAGVNRYTVTTNDKDLTTDLKVEKMTQTEFEDYLTALAADPDTVSEDYKNTLIYLPDSGELVIGSNLANNMNSEAATLNVTYNKEGFAVGETRPEMYFNCTNQSDASRANWITYTNYDADHNWISQNINYTVSNNQEMAINTQIHDVVDADCYRDLAEMTDIVQASIDAHTTVENIESMLKSSEYADEDSQNYLNDCLEKANKQMAYMDDHLQKVFGAQITNFENYRSKIDLAITNVGTKGDQLALAENRISNQQTTFKDLKSSNEDEELSDVTIDYTSAYTAFQASLQAAGKIDDMSLLDYL